MRGPGVQAWPVMQTKFRAPALAPAHQDKARGPPLPGDERQNLERSQMRGHGGDLTLTRTDETGTTFEIRLPHAPKPG